MRATSCFFTGHRIISTADETTVRRAVYRAVFDCIEFGVRDYIAGGAIGFDTIAAETIAEMKKLCDIRLRLFLPCKNHDVKWNNRDRERFNALLTAADEIRYISECEYFDGCMRLRNEAMVLEAEYCIAWCENHYGGTTQTLAIAKKLGCKIKNLAKEPLY